MTDMLLGRSLHAAVPSVPVPGAGRVQLARVHEVCGPSRRTLAVLWAQSVEHGPIIWVQPAWTQDTLYPAGLRHWVDPARFVWVQAPREPDVLWSLEEALRAGVGGVVVGDLPKVPSLTAVRRLHLAAEAGARGGAATLVMLLTPGDGGAPGVETRWHLHPKARVAAPSGEAGQTGQDLRAWQLERRRARMAPPAVWSVQADMGAGKISLRGDVPAPVCGV